MKRLGMIVAIVATAGVVGCTDMTPRQQGTMSGAAIGAAAGAGIDWQPVGGFEIARTETSVGQFRRFAEATGTTVLAEGIETEVQARQLIALGCEAGQGYLFGRPAPAAVARQWLSPLPENADEALAQTIWPDI